MSKITFRADDELVERLEAHDASKSEVMRQALRAYLDDAERDAGRGRESDQELAALFDRLLERRLRALLAEPVEVTETGRRESRPARGRREPGVVVSVRRERAGVSGGRERRRVETVRDRLSDTFDGGVSDANGDSMSDADGESVSDADDDSMSDTDDDSVSNDTGHGVSDDSERRASNASEQPPDRSCSRCGTELSDSHVYCPNCGEKAVQRLFCDCGDEIRSDWSFCPGCGRRTPAADVLGESDGVGGQ